MNPSIHDGGAMAASSQTDCGLRVLMTADAIGGVWQYALDLAEGLRPYGVETILAVLGPAPSPDQQAKAEAAGIRLVLTGHPLEWISSRPEEIEEAGRAVARMAIHLEADIVHLNNPALAASANYPAPVVAVCHSCVTTWWRAVRCGPLPEEFVWRTEMTRQGYRAANKLLAPTEAFSDATARAYDLAEPPTVVRNGRRSPPVSEERNSAPFIFTAGRLWDEGKNLAALDRVAAHLSIPVLAAGPVEGPNGTSITLHHIQPLGRLSDADIAQRLSAKPIFVSAARYEPFGLAVLEAAQAGCALVLSDIPTFRELWKDAALFVPLGDDQALIHTLGQLTESPEVRKVLGEKAKGVASAYNLDAMSAGVMAVYRSLLPKEKHTFSSEEEAA